MVFVHLEVCVHEQMAFLDFKMNEGAFLLSARFNIWPISARAEICHVIDPLLTKFEGRSVTDRVFYFHFNSWAWNFAR